LLPGGKEEENGRSQAINSIQGLGLANLAREETGPKERRDEEERNKNSAQSLEHLPASKLTISSSTQGGKAPSYLKLLCRSLLHCQLF
jgi:hypothetical protein